MQQITRFILLPTVIGTVLGLMIIMFNPNDDDRPGYAAGLLKHHLPWSIYTPQKLPKAACCAEFLLIKV